MCLVLSEFMLRLDLSGFFRGVVCRLFLDSFVCFRIDAARVIGTIRRRVAMEFFPHVNSQVYRDALGATPRRR
jgi:hypothetical protein